MRETVGMFKRLRLISRWQARHLLPGAKAGDAVEAFNLALALERLGRAREAEHWYRWVADTGDIDATCNLGLLLARTGRENEAIKYLGIAAKQGDADAAYNAGAVCEDTDDLEGAKYWYGMADELENRT